MRPSQLKKEVYSAPNTLVLPIKLVVANVNEYPRNITEKFRESNVFWHRHEVRC